MTLIHPTAIVEAGAALGQGVRLGPFCLVGAQAKLGDGVELISHAVVTGRTTIGEGTRIFPFASIGHRPQDLKYKGEPSTLVIGRRNTIREYVTMNPGTEGGGMITRVGDDCLFMASAHVAHDCHIGNKVVLANNVSLAGHITIQDHVIVSGNSAVQQFVRIGESAMVGGMSGVERDVIPYGMVIGDRARLVGLNLVGLQRRGFGRDEIETLRAAYDLLFGQESGTLSDRVAEVAARFAEARLVQNVVEFIRADNKRGLVQPKAGNGG